MAGDYEDLGSSPVPGYLVPESAGQQGAQLMPETAPMPTPEQVARAEAQRFLETKGVQGVAPPAPPPVPPSPSPGIGPAPYQEPSFPMAPTGPVTPAGMYPSKEKFTTKAQAPSEEADYYNDVAAGHGLIAADKREKAAYDYSRGMEGMGIAYQMGAQSAIREHQALQAERDRVVANRMAQIDDLNRQAAINPGGSWDDKAAQSRVIGTLVSALVGVGIGIAAGGRNGLAAGLTATGKTMQSIDQAIDQDIAYKFKQAEGNRANAAQQTNLLKAHLDALGDKDKAIDATRLAYYDDIARQIDVLKAQMGSSIDQAKAHELIQDIYEKKAQIENKLAGTIESEEENKYHAASGGTAGAVHKEPGNILTYNGTSYQFQNEKTMNEAAATLESFGSIIDMNNRILKLREDTWKLAGDLSSKADDQRDANIKTLESLELAKLKAMEQAYKQGVLRKEEYEEAKNRQGYATAGLSKYRLGAAWDKHIGPYGHQDYESGNAVIRAQNGLWTDQQMRALRTPGTSIVRKGYQLNPNTGLPEPRATWTGQDPALSGGLPPPGFKPFGSGSIPTMPQPDRKTTPYSPEVPYLAPPSNKKGGKKK